MSHVTPKEHWMMIKCKTADCDTNLLLQFIGLEEKHHFLLDGLVPEKHSVEWASTCPECQQQHLYFGSDVYIRTINSPGSKASDEAFRKALNNS